MIAQFQECFSCGKMISSKSEAVLNEHMNICLDRQPDELFSKGNNNIIGTRQMATRKSNILKNEIIVGIERTKVTFLKDQNVKSKIKIWKKSIHTFLRVLLCPFIGTYFSKMTKNRQISAVLFI